MTRREPLREGCIYCSDGTCPTCQPPSPSLDEKVRRFADATGASEERAREILTPRPRTRDE